MDDNVKNVSSSEMKKIIASILQMDSDQLNTIVSAINLRRRQFANEKKRLLGVGQRVYFINKGIRHEGVITKIMRKNVSVRVGYTTWRCSPTSLNIINQEEIIKEQFV